MKLHDLAEMGEEIGCAVIAGIKAKVVLNAFGIKFAVQSLGPDLEIVLVIASAIEVNGQLADGETICSGEQERIVLIPMRDVDWIAEHGGEDPGKRCAGAHSGVEFLRRRGHKSGTFRAHGRKFFRIGECETECAIAPHGYAANCPPRPTAMDAISAFNVGHEFLKKKVAVAHFASGGVDVKTGLGLRSDNEELADLVLLAKILNQVPSARFEKCLFVLAQTVKKVEHGILG